MRATNQQQLSSDYLYTYTSKLNNVKLMLKYGLRYSLNKEKLNPEQQNYIVCFCDILPEQSGYHRSVYGNPWKPVSKKMHTRSWCFLTKSQEPISVLDERATHFCKKENRNQTLLDRNLCSFELY